jgi:hypothetical protein
MMEIWMACAEIQVVPGDTPSGASKGFINVVTWADSAESAKDKLERYLQSFEWRLISIEDARPIDEGKDYGEEIEDMIDRTRSNPNAIILGTFHSYWEH